VFEIILCDVFGLIRLRVRPVLCVFFVLGALTALAMTAQLWLALLVGCILLVLARRFVKKVSSSSNPVLNHMQALKPQRPAFVSELYVYPVKSCRGVAVKSAAFDRMGLINDRRWMVGCFRVRTTQFSFTK